MARLEGIQLQAKKKAYQNHIDMLKAGKKLSKADLATMDSLWEEIQEAEKPAASQPDGADGYTISAPDLAGVFRVTSMTLSNWRKAGMPRLSHGQYPLLRCLDWWQDNIISKDDGDLTTAELQREHLREKIRKSRVEADQAEEKVMSHADVIEAWTWRMGEFRQALLSLPLRLPPILEGKGPSEMRDIIEAQARAILETICREGRYTQKKGRKPCRKSKRK